MFNRLFRKKISSELEIIQIEKITQNSIAITFSIDEKNKTNYYFKPGQFLTLEINLNNKKIKRSYSICSSPNEDSIKISIKKIKNGLFSNYAVNNFKKGDIINVEFPKGNFFYKKHSESSQNILLFAAGSGITPILSILKYSLEENNKNMVTLIYGNRSKDEEMFYEEIEAVEKKYKSRFSIFKIYSKVNYENDFFGRIDNNFLNKIFDKEKKLHDFDNYYICGPEDMILNLCSILEKNFISRDKINYEYFFRKNKKDSYDDINRDILYKVKYNNNSVDFLFSSKSSVLTAALSKFDVPFSCQGGSCGSCVCKLVNGEISNYKTDVLTKDEKIKGLFLSCQVNPTSSEIYIDFDDTI